MTKEERLKSLRLKAKEKSNLLLSNSRFNKFVMEFRRKWSIKDGGFTQLEFDQWLLEFTHLRHKYEPTESDISREKERHKRIHANSLQPAPGLDGLIEAKLNTKHLDARRALRNDIGSILREFKLNARWFSFIEHYLFLGEASDTKLPSGWEFSTVVDEISGQELITIKVTEEVRKQDLPFIWTELKDYQKQLPTYTREQIRLSPQIERNLKVYEMRQAGKSAEKIAAWLNTLDDGTTYGYEDVYKLVSEYQRLLDTKT